MRATLKILLHKTLHICQNCDLQKLQTDLTFWVEVAILENDQTRFAHPVGVTLI